MNLFLKIKFISTISMLSSNSKGDDVFIIKLTLFRSKLSSNVVFVYPLIKFLVSL